MKRQVVIDCFPESAAKYRESHTIVAVDVIRATTTVTTALDLGFRIFPVLSTDDAFVLGKKMKDPLYVGEIGGNVPYGFHISNSPAEIARRTDTGRPIIFISSSGTRLMLNADGIKPVYIACFRNMSAVAGFLSRDGRIENVALIGAGTRGQFRREDQMCCAWVAEKLIASGFEPEDAQTRVIIERWHGATPEDSRNGNSADFLRRTGQEHDLNFVVAHVDDLDIVPSLFRGEVLLCR